jgi:hypothetical protein
MQPLPPASLAWYVVGRFWTVPGHDELSFDAGYFLHLGPIQRLFAPGPSGASAGVDASPGTPAPGSAHFTFCSAPFSVRSVESSPLKVSADTAGDFSIYYQREPRGSFADPASFATGTRIARFRRPFAVVGEAIALAPDGTSSSSMLLNQFSAELIEAQAFEHAGRSWNIGELLPSGVTQWGVGLTLPDAGSAPAATFSGSAIAVGAGPRG